MPFALTGGRIDPQMTLGAHKHRSGLPSFTISPVVLYDQTLILTGNIPTQARVRWRGADSSLYQMEADNVERTVDSVPLQWNINRPAAPAGGGIAWSVRCLASLGPDPWSAEAAPIGTWIDISADRRWRIDRPASGTAENTGIFEMAQTADTTILFARARITLRYVRI